MDDVKTSLPVEVLLMMIACLNTRDVVVLGLTCKSLQSIAEDERKKRLDMDIDRLLLRYVDDPDHFRCLMRDTGGIIVGKFAKAFFTGECPPMVLELLFPPGEPLAIHPWLDSWQSFVSKSGMTLSCVWKGNFNGRWTREVS